MLLFAIDPRHLLSGTLICGTPYTVRKGGDGVASFHVICVHISFYLPELAGGVLWAAILARAGQQAMCTYVVQDSACEANGKFLTLQDEFSYPVLTWKRRCVVLLAPGCAGLKGIAA